MTTYHTVPLPRGPLGLTFSKVSASPFKVRITNVSSCSPLVGKVCRFDVVDQYNGAGMRLAFAGPHARAANSNLLENLLSSEINLDGRVLVVHRQALLFLSSSSHCAGKTPTMANGNSYNKDDALLYTPKHGITLSEFHVRKGVLKVEAIEKSSHLLGLIRSGDIIASAICSDGHETTDAQLVSRSLQSSSPYCQAIVVVRTTWIPIPVGDEHLGITIMDSPPKNL